MTIMKKQTRGERNKNPGNLRKSTIPWQGKVEGTDPDFETFDTPEYGIRALCMNLKHYYTKNGLRTVTEIISHYAPPNGNNTAAYIKAVAEGMGVDKDEDIDLSDFETMQNLVTEIIRHENGHVIFADDIEKGIIDVMGGGR